MDKKSAGATRQRFEIRDAYGGWVTPRRRREGYPVDDPLLADRTQVEQAVFLGGPLRFEWLGVPACAHNATTHDRDAEVNAELGQQSERGRIVPLPSAMAWRGKAPPPFFGDIS